MTQLSLELKNLGLVPYQKALDLQYTQHALCLAGKSEGLLFALEHKPVITLGKHAESQDVLFSEDFLKERGVALVRTERGGKATCHMPGQLVFYPILPLSQLSLGTREYVKILEESCLDLLGEFDVQGELKENHPGIWVNDKKIASVGVRIRDRVSLHGLAINVDNDLDLFHWIVLCGLKDVSLTRLVDETSLFLDKKSLISRFAEKLAHRLGMTLQVGC